MSGESPCDTDNGLSKVRLMSICVELALLTVHALKFLSISCESPFIITISINLSYVLLLIMLAKFSGSYILLVNFSLKSPYFDKEATLTSV